MVAVFLDGTISLGSILTAVIVGLVGVTLTRRTKEIHVLVNQRMTDATEQIRRQNLAMVAQDERIATLEKKLGLGPGESPSL